MSLKRAIAMGTSRASPFSRAVVNAMRRLYPESLADKSFDNTGLLLEAPQVQRQSNSVLLTVDLTKAVADEAIARRDAVVIAYHPIIFRGLKSLTLADTQQHTLLRLAAEGISVYSPHTAIDAAPGGLGDWLADIVTGDPADHAEDAPAAAGSAPENADTDTLKRPSYMLQHHPSQLSVKKGLSLGAATHTRAPITPSKAPGYEKTNAGMGRLVRFSTPQPLLDIVDRISLGLGNPKGFPIAVPQGKSAHEMQISSVAICAGSGGGLFGGMDEHADLLFTGELSHHEALAAIERGQCVITLFHSNTERGFLHSVLKPQLEREVPRQWDAVCEQDGIKQDPLHDGHVEIHVSDVDRDPYGIMIRHDEV